MVFVLVYTLFPHAIFTMFTSEAEVVETAMYYHLWCSLVLIVSMPAFVWDGVFIGVTETRGMLVAVATACALFFTLYFSFPSSWGNHTLWISFVAFLSTRSLVQTFIWLKRW